MTGFGAEAATHNGVTFALEIRTVNHRYLKTSIKLPDTLQPLEPAIEKLASEKLRRGSVTIVLRIRDQSETAAFDINGRALAAYAAELGNVKLQEGVQPTIDLAALALLPGVCQMRELAETERKARESKVIELVSRVFDEVSVMRRREGETLMADIEEQCTVVRQQLKLIEERAPTVVQEYHARLASRVDALQGGGRLELDQDAIAREVAIYAERCDISEEIVRLRGHMDHMREVCEEGGAAGRKLDFLAQEMYREANTIGSKSNDGRIARFVVELKTRIDRIKEQVQNAE